VGADGSVVIRMENRQCGEGSEVSTVTQTCQFHVAQHSNEKVRFSTK
jgi:hypothetical protein